LSSLTSRTIVLTISRIVNFGFGIIAPMLLVRVLDVKQYGQYREFLLYVTLFAPFLSFAIDRNLLYFIPRCPDRERQYVTHNVVFLMVTSAVGFSVIGFGRDFFLARASYDFVLPLLLCLFLEVNMNFLDSYWIARGRSDLVLYYSAGWTALRVSTVVLVALFFRDVPTVVWAMIGVSAARFLFVFIFAIFRRLLTLRVDVKVMREQMVYFVPLGLITVIYYTNREVSRLCISAMLGVEALAIYSIGSYQVPIIRIVRGAISDVIFPEMARINVVTPRKGLRLWQQATTIYCFCVFPVFCVLTFFAEALIETLFTSEYVAAAPLFRVYLIFMVRQCIDLGTPLRAMNQNAKLTAGGILAFAVNLPLLFILLEPFGMLGPAIAFVVADLAAAIYATGVMMRTYQIPLSGVLDWQKMGRIAGACLLSLPILFAARFVPVPDVAQAILFSPIFCLAYFLIVRHYRMEEVERVVSKLSQRRSGK
jgi:O-antigen/teichoic acid export membrane protein